MIKRIEKPIPIRATTTTYIIVVAKAVVVTVVATIVIKIERIFIKIKIPGSEN